MIKGFWKELNKNFSVLAPMYDVTDVVFREVIFNIARPDVFFTEFVSSEAYIYGDKDNSLQKLLNWKNQLPVVVQIWGVKPENYYTFAKDISKMGFSGIDINMGCPQKTEMKLGVCAALIKNQPLAQEIIQATIEGAGDMPVSVKTRTGVTSHVTEQWISFLLQFDLSAITLHGRTAKQMSAVPADWEQIKKAVELRNSFKKDTLIIGNGDVIDYVHGNALCNDFGSDGYMIGRGIFANPWAFSKNQVEPTIDQKITLMKNHIDLYESTYGDTKNFSILKKYFKIYLSGFAGASSMRQNVMNCNTYDEVRKVLKGLQK